VDGARAGLNRQDHSAVAFDEAGNPSPGLVLSDNGELVPARGLDDGALESHRPHEHFVPAFNPSQDDSPLEGIEIPGEEPPTVEDIPSALRERFPELARALYDGLDAREKERVAALWEDSRDGRTTVSVAAPAFAEVVEEAGNVVLFGDQHEREQLLAAVEAGSPQRAERLRSQMATPWGAVEVAYGLYNHADTIRTESQQIIREHGDFELSVDEENHLTLESLRKSDSPDGETRHDQP
jgi:hypothetical protein